MKELTPPRSRRQFLRAAAGLGALALGGEVALGAGLRSGLAPSAFQQSDCRSFTRTGTVPSAHTVIRAGTRTITTFTTSTRTSGTVSKTLGVGGTNTQTITEPGPPTQTYTMARSVSVSPKVTYVFTYSYASGNLTITQSIPSPYSMSVSLTVTQLYWRHGEDCNGHHDDDDIETPSEDIISTPSDRVGSGSSVDVLDVNSRWPVFQLPVIG